MDFLTKLKDKLFSFLSDDMGIDLGTANTLVYVKGKGIIINEPTVVALNQKTGQIVAVGRQAEKMLGRAPQHISVIRPLVDGVISDFEVAEEMLSYFIRRAQEGSTKLLGPRVVIGVPSSVTNVERRAVKDAAKGAGAREVHIIEEPIAAAIGARLPVASPVGNMVVDIGGGTTDVAIITLNGIVGSRNIPIAGDKLNQDIISFVRDTFQTLIGEKTAEEIKIKIGSVLNSKGSNELSVRGRDLVSGLPKEIVVTELDVRDAIAHSIDALIDGLREVIEESPPEVVADVMGRGIYLAGGGVLIQGFDELLSDVFGVPVYIVDNPLTAVARGTGAVLEDFDQYRELLFEESTDFPLQ